MRTKKSLPAILFLFLFPFLFSLNLPDVFSLTAVKDSSEDLFWDRPMTVHDYKKKSDLHNIAVSVLALSELEFVRMGDDLLHFTFRKPQHPISNSLNSLDEAYRKLPQIEPVERIGQLFDALQLRQLSLSDARVIGAFLNGQEMGGITPITQVRIYKLLVWLEDIIYDLDGAIMFPVNWELTALRRQPTRAKSLGYVADGMGYLRWEIFSAIRSFNRELVRLGSNLITRVERSRDIMIRRKHMKLNRHIFIYSKMPLPVYLENRKYFKGRKKVAFAGTIDSWYDLAIRHPEIWLEQARKETNILAETPPAKNAPQEIIIVAEYATWTKVPPQLKQYVITEDEVINFVRMYHPPGAGA